MPLTTASWRWQTVNNSKCGFPMRKLPSIDVNSYQREQKRVKVIILITPHNASSLIFFLISDMPF